MSLKSLLKKNKFTYAAANALRKAPYPLLKGWMHLCHGVFGVNKNKVYFSSFGGKLYNENPKYVCEALHEVCPEAKIVFRLNGDGMRQSDVPDYVKKVSQMSPAAFFHMATAKVIVKNATLMPYMKKFADQKYIQLWHGDRGLKKILLDLDPAAAERHPDWKYMDIGVSGSEFGSRVYMRSAFGYKGELMEVGYPKNDLLIANPPEVREKVYAALKLPENTKFILYAPTFRDQTIGGAISANFSAEALLKAMEAETGEKWMILNRGHILNSAVKSDAGIDVSRYPDVSELLLVCDMMITDYSSIAGDYLLMNRPIILYHADVAQYAAQERGLVFDPEESPYRIAHNMDELIEIACNFGDAEENCRALAEFYGVRESGRASLMVAERIKEFIG